MNILLLITVSLFVVSGVTTLQCYVCNSYHSGEDCSSSGKIKNSTEFLVNCTDLPEGERYHYCRKMYQHVPNSEGRIEARIVRECGYENTTVNTCHKAGLYKVGEQLVCSCTEDGCNYSSQLKSETVIVFLLFAFSTLLL